MGLSLTLERVRELAREYALIPLCLDVIADLETPVTAYLKVARGPYSFLLESVEGGERLARYSFIGTEPRAVLRFEGDICIIMGDQLAYRLDSLFIKLDQSSGSPFSAFRYT